MKKTLVALAALAAAGGAFAQSGNARAISGSGVEIAGGLDARVNYMSATNAGTLSRLDNSGEYSSRLIFRGMEDIGGGWAAGFWLEAGVGNDDGRGQNSTSNNTNMGQNFSVGTGNVANNAAATSGTTQLSTPSSSGLNGLQGLTFNRASVVSLLNKGFGEIRVGRDYAPTFWNNTVYDPFGTLGVGSANNVILGTLNPAGASIAPPGTAKPQVRTSNSVGWLSNDMSGFRVQLQYAFSEVTSNCLGLSVVTNGQSVANSCVAAAGDGKYIGARIQYNSGPVSVAASTGTTSYGSATADMVTGLNAMNGAWLNTGGNVPFTGDYKVTNFGGAYDAKVAKFFAQYGEQVQGGFTGVTYAANTNTYALNAAVTESAKLKHYLLGVTVPQGNMLYKLSYNSGTRAAGAGVNNDRTQTQLAVGAVYNFSKRTAVYGTYSSMTASGLGATASMALTSSAVTATSGDVKATGYDVGLRHTF